MVKRTVRIDDYTYDKLRTMARYYHMSVNSLMIELMQIGYIEKEKWVIYSGN